VAGCKNCTTRRDFTANDQIGRSIKRLEDGRLLRGEGQFVDDLQPPGLLHVCFARSPVASGRLSGVDVSVAQAAPGVVAVFTAADLEGTCLPLTVHLTTPDAISPARPILAADRVRFAGEMVAAVVADSRYHAADAVDQVQPEIEALEAITSYQAAMAAGATLVHDGVPGNLYFLGHRAFGDVPRAFAEADLVVDGAVTHPRVSAAPMEGRGVVAMPAATGRVTLWTSTQVPHLVATAVAECLALEPGQVQVIAADVGGGFGIKAQVYPEEILLAWIARRTNRTVKWTETRSEHFLSASPARDQHIDFSAAVRRDGRVLGLRATVHSSIGAYGIRPFGPLLDPMTCAGLIPGPYDIRDYEYDSYAVATNQCPEGPYRGVGMVTAVLAHERLMDLVATRLSLDPATVRRVNFVTPQQMPYSAVTGHPYESGDYPAALESALARFGYQHMREEQARARAQGRLVGLGLCSYVEFTGAGSSTFQGRGMADIPGTDTARVWLDGDGRVHVQTTCPAIGQGSHTTFAQVVAERLGVEAEGVIVEQTDTGKVGFGTGSFMSRGSVTAATSAYRAAGLLRDAILNAASWRLDQPVERLSIGDSSVVVRGEPAGVTLAQLAATDPADLGGHALDISVTYDAAQASHPYATHACLVEVDGETGAAQILRYVVAEDCGVLINPKVVEGQVVGGVAQGVGATLMEEIAYGADGQLLTGSFLDYLVPSAGEVPTVEITHLVTPSTVHELGTKGVGEGGTIGATAAVANAIADALSVSDATLPFTPDRIVALIQSKHG
jgi:aerobic carbon-monoxide dehydrogenase large subunit